MKTLTVKQPWASLIVEGIKDIENRTWKTKFRGRVLIHTGQSFIGRGWDEFPFPLSEMQSDFLEDSNQSLHTTIFDNNLIRSAIIGSVEIVDCVINHESIWAEKTAKNYYDQTGEFNEIKPIYNWVLANPIKFETPIENVKGKLSLWDFDVEGYFLSNGEVLLPIWMNHD